MEWKCFLRLVQFFDVFLTLQGGFCVSDVRLCVAAASFEVVVVVGFLSRLPSNGWKPFFLHLTDTAAAKIPTNP